MNERTTANGDFAAIVELFAGASPMTASHWNLATGETFAVRHARRQRALVEAFEERLFDDEDGGWVEVPFLESDDAFNLVRAWVADLSPGKGKAELQRAIAGDKPFRAFRTTLKKGRGWSGGGGVSSWTRPRCVW